MTTYYAELITKSGTSTTPKFPTRTELLQHLINQGDAMEGVDVRFYNIVQNENGMRLYNGL